MDLSSYDNAGYNPGRKIKILAWYIVSSIFFETKIPFPSVFKCILLRMFGAEVGSSVVVKPNVKIKYPWLLSVGDFSWIGELVWIDNLVGVSIGENCCISQGAYILTGNHDYTKYDFPLRLGSVCLESGVWLGAKSIVCPGVKLGENAILTVGSIANKNVPKSSIYQGNPAVFVRARKIK